LHPEAYKKQEENPGLEESISVNTTNLLDPEDFDVYFNPRLHAESVE
jgi:hypothetical protein